jgi:hypothetical protein
MHRRCHSLEQVAINWNDVQVTGDKGTVVSPGSDIAPVLALGFISQSVIFPS